jgi:hypothetical protein
MTQLMRTRGRFDTEINYVNASYSSSQARYQQVAQEIAIKSVNTWYEEQRSRAQEKVLQDSIEALRKYKERMEDRAEKGVSPDADLTLAVTRQLGQLTGSYLSQFMLFEDAADPEVQSSPPSEWRFKALGRDSLLLITVVGYGSGSRGYQGSA